MTQRYRYGMMELSREGDGLIGRSRGGVVWEGRGVMRASKELIERWRADPTAEVSVIIHVDGSPEQFASKVVEHGLTIGRVFRLTDTISAGGAARAVLGLLEEPWVRRVELDQEIRATS